MLVRWREVAGLTMLRLRICSLLRTKCIKPEPRTLYSATALGFDGYLDRRENFEIRFKDLNNDTFRERMKEHITKEESLIFTEDLKSMIHLIKKDDKQDVDIFMQMLKKFNSQNKKLRFGTYVFGPVIMRMFYFLDKPEIAFEILQNSETQLMFDQVSSYLILMDCFFKQKKYDQVLRVFQLLQDRQLFGMRNPKDCVVLALAACYKMDTKESFDFAIKVLEGLKESGSVLLRRGITIAAMLALNQGNAAYALKILSLANQINYFTVRNLMMMAFSDLDRLDEVFLTLKALMQTDRSEQKGIWGDLFRECFDKIKAAVERSGSKEKMSELMTMEKAFSDAKRICEESLDSILMQEITPKTIPFDRFKQNGYSRRQNLFLNKNQVRKGIMDLED